MKEKNLNEEDDLLSVTPIPALTDNQITDETLIYYHKGLPIYIDFLHINDRSKASDNVMCYFDKIKTSLTLKKWGSMKEKDKIYYLYNKIQYYNNLISIKEASKNKFESMIETKSKEIKNLQVLIYEKEIQYEKSGNNNQVDIMSKRDII